MRTFVEKVLSPKHISLISFKGSSALKGDGPLSSVRADGQNNLLRLLRAKKVVLFHMNLKLKEKANKQVK